MAYNFACPQCGATISAPDAAAGQPGTCVFCHANIIAPALEGLFPQTVQPPSQPVVLANADVGRRGVAWLIDYVLLCAVVLPVNLLLGFTRMVTTSGESGWHVNFPTGPAGWLLGSVVAVIYGTTMESSGWRATVGKRILGVQVLDTACQPLSRRKALTRNLVKAVTAPVSCCAWMYAVAIFSPRNQALHDIAADTLVLYNS